MINKKGKLRVFTYFLDLNKIKCFKPCFLLFFAVLFLSIIFHFLGEVFPDIKQLLAVSSSNVWGIITSFFVHKDASHLTNNMRSMLIFTLAFMFSNIYYDRKVVERRALYFTVLTVLAAIFSNFLWIIVRPNVSAAGASGMVYAIIGLTFGFSINNFICSSLNLPATKRTWKQSPKKDKANFLFFYTSNVLIFSCILFYASLLPQEFLSKGPNVNTFIHSISFCTSLLLCMATIYFPRVSKLLLNNKQTMENVEQLLVLLVYEVTGFFAFFFLTLILLLGGIFKFLSLILVAFISVYTISGPFFYHFYRNVYTYVIILPIPFLGSWIISLMFLSSLNAPILPLCLLSSFIPMGLITIMHFTSRMRNILGRIPLAIISREGTALTSLLFLYTSLAIFGSVKLTLLNKVMIYSMLLLFYAATSIIYVNSMYRYRLLCRRLNIRRIEQEISMLWNKIEIKYADQPEKVDLLRYYLYNALYWFIEGDYEKAFMEGYKVIREPTVVDPTMYVNDKRENRSSFSEIRTILMHSKRKKLEIDVERIRETKKSLPQDCVDLLVRDILFLRKIASDGEL